MFSSLASFLFGSNTNCETNSNRTAAVPATATGLNEKSVKDNNSVDVDNLLQVTSLTPSVTGAGDRAQSVAIKRGKNKRNNVRQQKKRNEVKTPLSPNSKKVNVLTPSNSCDEEGEFDEEEWFIVEKEEEEPEDFPARNDSEEENVPVSEPIKTKKLLKPAAGNNLAQQRAQQHISLHSSYSGPQQQKQHKSLHKLRNNTTSNGPGKGLSVSTLSPSRTVADGCCGSKHETSSVDDAVSYAMCVAAPNAQQDGEKSVMATNDFDAVNSMEESWFVTPPPCFTSIGPINMETSPYENLLIEHPSMSVYHSIKNTLGASDEITVKLDIGANLDLVEEEVVEKPTSKNDSEAVQPRLACQLKRGYVVENVQKDTQTLQPRLARNPLNILKRTHLFQSEQKLQIKYEQQEKNRAALKRTNKVRDYQSRNHVQRRSDRQYSKCCSNVSNNRKTNCY